MARSGVDQIQRKVLIEHYGKWIWFLREHPSHAAHYLTGIALPPHERLWLRLFFSEYKTHTIVASRGTSKCAALGTLVIMADGSRRKIEEVRVGEQVMGPDGQPRNVLDTTRGWGPMYRVEQSQGMTYEVNDAHILALKWNSQHQDVCTITVKAFHQSDPDVQRRLLGFRGQEDGSSRLTVTPIGEGEYAGFTLDGDHLFLLEDGTVTHNSFSHASMAAPLKAALYKNLGILTVSASGFRGGKLLLEDAKRMILGQLKSQELDGDYLRRTCEGKNIIRQDPDRWAIKFTTHSHCTTVPSNNEDNLRGIRANIAIIDERNTFDGEVVDKVIVPWMNVGQSFRATAGGADNNQIFQVSTIDYTTRDWHPKIQQARSLAQRQYEAQKALMRGDFERYEELMGEHDNELKVASFSYSRIDYTDLLIPEVITELETGERYRVNYPLPSDLQKEDVLVYDERDREWLYYTYPVDKKGLEEPWRDGTMDEEMWLAEQRNVFITSAGSVFPHDLIQAISERKIYEEGKVPGFEAGSKEPYEDAFFAPLMYTCGDPCVIGLDYARESDQFAIVVIRLGELAEGKFDPWMREVDSQGRVLLGKTPWNHICWAESWSRWTAHEAAERIRSLLKRYHVINTPEYGGMGMDKKGGGTAVRDELAQPKPPVVHGKPDPSWTEPIKLYDPEDEDYAHYKGYSDTEKYWGGLRLLTPGNQDNTNWVSATKALMETKKLYLARWQSVSDWTQEKRLVNAYGAPDKGNPDYFRWKTGYDGIYALRMQLTRIQMKASSTGVIRYVMPSSRLKEEGKKDLFSATIYAVQTGREHLKNTSRSDEVPMVAPVMVQIGSDYSGNRAGYPTLTSFGGFPL